MKLAVSNIAWPAEEDARAYALLRAHGIEGIEIAPTRVWPEWRGMTAAGVRDFRHTVESAGLTISSLQALLFNRPDLRLFGTGPERAAMREHLWRCADVAVALGAGALVFGAPVNRRRGSLPERDALAMAVELFGETAPYFAERGVALAFEANPVAYKCDFATDSATAARLVRAVASPGFRLQIDTGCAQLAGDDPSQIIEDHFDIVEHVHASEPYLAGFGTPGPGHEAAARTLRRLRYARWVSLEMRASDAPLTALGEAARYLRTTYGDG